jgi:hypothetical protein
MVNGENFHRPVKIFMKIFTVYYVAVPGEFTAPNFWGAAEIIATDLFFSRSTA